MFDPFGDFETAGYLQNSLQLKDPTEVKESEHLSFELSIEDALAYLAKKKLIDYEAVLSVHEILFSHCPLVRLNRMTEGAILLQAAIRQKTCKRTEKPHVLGLALRGFKYLVNP